MTWEEGKVFFPVFFFLFLKVLIYSYVGIANKKENALNMYSFTIL